MKVYNTVFITKMREIVSTLPDFIQLGVLSLPIILLTKNQIKAILKRDNRQCLFSAEHECKGKMSVHHIDGKEDIPENLSSVCRSSHWEYLHNGRAQKDVDKWNEELKRIAKDKTDKAVSSGWSFPKS